MNRKGLTNRRTFLQRVGAVSATVLLPGSSFAATASLQSRYVVRTELNRVEVWKGHSQRWKLVQILNSERPASSVIHPSRQFLYVANAVSHHEGLPQGTVETYSIDGQSRLLSFIQRQALSLSGTEPHSLAITPDGQYLLVALYGGGAYNVLSIEPDGKLTPVRRIFKELGSGLHPTFQASSHPHTILFDHSGRLLLTSDFGCDRLSVFALSHDGELERRSKSPIAPGAGPGAMALSSDGSSLYVMHELAGAISCHRYWQNQALVEEPFQTVPLHRSQRHGTPERGALELDATGRYLSAQLNNRLTRWTIGPSGELTSQQRPASS